MKRVYYLKRFVASKEANGKAFKQKLEAALALCRCRGVEIESIFFEKKKGKQYIYSIIFACDNEEAKKDIESMYAIRF